MSQTWKQVHFYTDGSISYRKISSLRRESRDCTTPTVPFFDKEKSRNVENLHFPTLTDQSNHGARSYHFILDQCSAQALQILKAHSNTARRTFCSGVDPRRKSCQGALMQSLTLPSNSVQRPASVRTKAVLPLPDGPMMSKESPRFTERERLRKPKETSVACLATAIHADHKRKVPTVHRERKTAQVEGAVRALLCAVIHTDYKRRVPPVHREGRNVRLEGDVRAKERFTLQLSCHCQTRTGIEERTPSLTERGIMPTEKKMSMCSNQKIVQELLAECVGNDKRRE